MSFLRKQESLVIHWIPAFAGMTYRKWHFFRGFKLIFVAVAIILFSSSPGFAKDRHLVRISRDDKVMATVNVEIAKTDLEKARGLMFRRSLAEGEGMWFAFDRDTSTPFWMKNTYISLDIIFIDGEGRIITIAKGTTPFSEKPVYSSDRYRYVLEVKAGFADKYGIRAGDNASLIQNPLPFSQRLIRPLAEMGGGAGEGAHNGYSPSPRPPLADFPLPSRERENKVVK